MINDVFIVNECDACVPEADRKFTNVFNPLVPAQEPGSRARGDRGSNQGTVPTPYQSKGGESRWEGVRQQIKELYVFNDSRPCLFSISSFFSLLSLRKQKCVELATERAEPVLDFEAEASQPCLLLWTQTRKS